MVLTLGIAGTFVAGFYAYVTHDNIEFMDDKVGAAAATACARLDAELSRLPAVQADTSKQAKVERLQREAQLMRQLTGEVRRVGQSALADDVPSEDWLRDWSSLADARVAYAAQLAAGTVDADFVEPRTSDGYPISGRMKDTAPDACRVVDRVRRSLP